MSAPLSPHSLQHFLFSVERKWNGISLLFSLHFPNMKVFEHYFMSYWLFIGLLWKKNLLKIYPFLVWFISIFIVELCKNSTFFFFGDTRFEFRVLSLLGSLSYVPSTEIPHIFIGYFLWAGIMPQAVDTKMKISTNLYFHGFIFH
jgi:hypothetical protein